MKQIPRVDRSYRERRQIVKLLDFLAKDNVTKHQIERIGRRLQRSGERALPPLVRRIWREHDQERMYRYTCMLDYFDEAAWLDQIVSVTLKRKDLAEDGRLPLLDLLQDYGVDTTQPPFNRDRHEEGSSLRDFVSRALDEGYWGGVRFMDRMLEADEGVRNRLVQELVDAENKPQVAGFLRMLAGFEYREVAVAAMEALGRVRHPAALAALEAIGPLAVDGLDRVLERSKQRLHFLGVREAIPLPTDWCRSTALVVTEMGPVDFNGLRVLWFSWALDNGTYASLVVQVGDEDGVHYAVSSRFDTRGSHDEYLEEVHGEEILYEVSAPYAIAVLRGALFRSLDKEFYLPPELYASRYLFGTEDVTPLEYEPHFSVEMMEDFLEKVAEHLSDADRLFEDRMFDGWVVSEPQVFDIVAVMDGVPLEECSLEMQQIVLHRFCQELLEPHRSILVRRLLLQVDFMIQLERPLHAIQSILAVAISIASGILPLEKHPFVRQLVFNSLETAALVAKADVGKRYPSVYLDDDWDD